MWGQKPKYNIALQCVLLPFDKKKGHRGADSNWHLKSLHPGRIRSHAFNYNLSPCAIVAFKLGRKVRPLRHRTTSINTATFSRVSVCHELRLKCVQTKEERQRLSENMTLNYSCDAREELVCVCVYVCEREGERERERERDRERERERERTDSWHLLAEELICVFHLLGLPRSRYWALIESRSLSAEPGQQWKSDLWLGVTPRQEKGKGAAATPAVTNLALRL